MINTAKNLASVFGPKFVKQFQVKYCSIFLDWLSSPLNQVYLHPPASCLPSHPLYWGQPTIINPILDTSLKPLKFLNNFVFYWIFPTSSSPYHILSASEIHTYFQKIICLKQAVNLGPKPLSLLEFETWWLRLLSHHSQFNNKTAFTDYRIFISMGGY